MNVRTIITLAVSLAASVFSLRGADGIVVGNFRYDIVEFVGHDGPEAVVVGFADGFVPSGELAFPTEIENGGKTVPVTGLGWGNHTSHEGDAPVVGGLDGITSVRIPRYMRWIGRFEFKDCPNIASYSVEDGSEYFMTIGGALVERRNYTDEEILELTRYPSGAKATTYVVPAKVSYISLGAFAANSALKRLYLVGGQWLKTGWQYNNKGIAEIDCTNSHNYRTREDGAVYYGSGLYSLCPGRKYSTFTIPATSTSIHPGAFCSADVEEVVVHADVSNPTTDYAFLGSSVKRVTFLGQAPSTISEGAFMECPSLESIAIGTNSTANTYVGHYAFLGCRSLASVSLSESIRTLKLGFRAFDGCASLAAFPLTSKMKIPELPARAFAGCEALESFLFGTVGAFEDLVGHQFAGSGLKQVHWPTGFKNIPRGCFRDCKRLEKVYLKESTENIYEDAFRGSGLVAINLMGVDWYSESAFRDCPDLMRLYFPDNGKSTSYRAVDFRTDGQIIVNNPKIDWLEYQEEYPGKAALYISMVNGCKIGNGWRKVFAPGRAGELYSQLTDAEVEEMFVYETFPEENAVAVRPCAEGVKIVAVSIEGIEATLSDGKYRAEGAAPADGKMNVTVNYTVFGNAMTSTYDMTYTSAPLTEALDSPEAEWYTPAGVKADKASLRPGIYIVREGSRTRKTIVR